MIIEDISFGFICNAGNNKYLRVVGVIRGQNIDLSETMTYEFFMIAVNGQELKADG
jgi:hypothetical protein